MTRRFEACSFRQIGSSPPLVPRQPRVSFWTRGFRPPGAARGYADTFPLALTRDATDTPIPVNQARNRRVVIRLEKVA